MKLIQLFISTLLLFSFSQALGQDIINAYTFPNLNGLPKPTYNNATNYWHYDSEKPIVLPYYGEYQIFTNLLNWNLPPLHNFARSIKLEVVSYPMTNHCWYELGGCTIDNQGTNAQHNFRHMDITNDPLIGENWGLLYRTYEGIPDDYCVLMSQRYASAGSISAGRKPLPHTIIKHTLNLHCGLSTFDDIISSLSWVSDHSRGRMRTYPFNCDESQPLNFDYVQDSYDLMFQPEILIDYNIDYNYNQVDNKMWIDDGMHNLFKFSEVPQTPCNNSLYPSTSSVYYDFLSGFTSYPSPPPFAILGNVSVRSDRGKMIAGYNTSPPPIVLDHDGVSGNIKYGIKHKYTIDYNFLLEQINPAQRIIYNFSEVDITAPELFFPSGYTFKTIRGVYPTLSEVALSMGVAGNYHDLRDVPVITDLVGEDQSDATNNQQVRASKYYIKSSGKLTIEPCVTIYDATFLKEANSTLVFQDRESTYGRFQIFEEVTSGPFTHTFTNQQGITLNYNLVDSEGQVTKPVSLVLPGQTFLYESSTFIESGMQQQLPVNLNLPYEISPATHVVFVAENEIKLTEGFHASAHTASNQSVFHAMIWPSDCSNIVNRQAASVSNNQVNYQPQSQLYPTSPVLTPNPTAHGSVLHYSVLEPQSVSVRLYNATGQLVSVPQYESLKEKGNHSVAIHTEGMPPGIYMCTLLTTSAGNSKPMQVSKKLVVR